MSIQIILIGIDGLGRTFNENCSKLNNFFKNGSIVYVTANVPTDSAPNWGSILTGVIPNKHKLKLEELDQPYNNEKYPSIFKIMLSNFKDYKIAAYVSWEPIITGMIEKNLQMEKYAPLLNENFLSKFWMRFSHFYLNNPNYDSFLVPKILKYIQDNSDFNFLFIHLVDLDEIGHIYGFKSEKYMKKLNETDKYIDLIISEIYKNCSNPLILITTDHGGLDKSHGGNSENEINVFIGSNSILNKNLKSNMCCSRVILNNLCINIPNYFDTYPQI